MSLSIHLKHNFLLTVELIFERQKYLYQRSLNTIFKQKKNVIVM